MILTCLLNSTTHRRLIIEYLRLDDYNCRGHTQEYTGMIIFIIPIYCRAQFALLAALCTL